MLRHFESLAPLLEHELLRAGYTSSLISKELNVPGSRFYQSFAVDIPTLLKQVFKGGYAESVGDNGNTVFHGQACQLEFLEGIGTKGVVPIEEIPLEKRSHIFTQNNRGIKLLHYHLDKLPSTWDFTLVLRRTTNGFVFITSFPGLPAMPLPSYRLAQKEYDKCKEYWDKHVFLVEKMTTT